MVQRRPDVPTEVEDVIDARSDEFNAALEQGDFEAANWAARASWDVIPEPKDQWDYYPEVLPRDYVDLFARAGNAKHAAEWLRIAMASKSAQVGESVTLDRVAARVRLVMGDRETAEKIAGTLLELFGTRPFTGDDKDLLPLAQAYKAREGMPDTTSDEVAAVELPLASEGAATQHLDLDDEIERLSEAGSQAMDNEDWRLAVRHWMEALSIIPSPRTDWSAATWLYTCIGDAYYEGGRLDEAKLSLSEALKCAESRGSAFLWLRLGQVLTDGGNIDGGTEALMSAYMLEGAEIFAEQDSKYLDLLADRVDLDR